MAAGHKEQGPIGAPGRLRPWLPVAIIRPALRESTPRGKEANMGPPSGSLNLQYEGVVNYGARGSVIAIRAYSLRADVVASGPLPKRLRRQAGWPHRRYREGRRGMRPTRQRFATPACMTVCDPKCQSADQEGVASFSRRPSAASASGDPSSVIHARLARSWGNRLRSQLLIGPWVGRMSYPQGVMYRIQKTPPLLAGMWRSPIVRFHVAWNRLRPYWSHLTYWGPLNLYWMVTS